MTINKSQGQSLNKIGVYLPQPVFSHGQLYVALSRATSPEGLKILMKSDDRQPTDMTKNIVYKDFLTHICTEQVSHIFIVIIVIFIIIIILLLLLLSLFFLLLLHYK